MNKNQLRHNYLSALFDAQVEYKQESKNASYPFEILRFSQIDNDILNDSYVYVTSGISDFAQPGETSDPKFKNIEFSAYSDFLITNSAIKNSDIIADLMGQIALFPFQNQTALEQGQTFDFGRPLIPNSEMEGFYFSSPPFIDYSDLLYNTKSIKSIIHLVPISRKEMEYKLEHGVEAFLELMEEEDVEPFMDLKRKSVL